MVIVFIFYYNVVVIVVVVSGVMLELFLVRKLCYLCRVYHHNAAVYLVRDETYALLLRTIIYVLIGKLIGH